MKKLKKIYKKKSSIAIEVINFYKKFKKNHIGPFNLQVNKGKMHSIIGTSGSGKTVFIKSLIGGFKRYKGKILINNQKAGTIKAKLNIGYIPEYITFPDKISAYNFLKNLGEINGLKGEYLKYRIEFLMKSLELWNFKNQNINIFSSGMKKKIMIIQGIIHDPDILILDEPEAGLDIENREKIIKYLKNLTLLGKTVFFSSHLLNEIKEYIDEFTLIINGRQFYTGEIKKFQINNTYYLKSENNLLIQNFLTKNKIKNWYEKNKNQIYFIIPSPLFIFFITKFAINERIKITKIAPIDLSFNFLDKKINDQ